MTDKRMNFIVRSIIILIGIAFLTFGFIVEPKNSDNTLWDALHPASVLNWVGVGFFSLSLIALTGAFNNIAERTLGESYVNVAMTIIFVAGAISIPLMFA